MMRVYVASKFENHARVREVQEQLRAAGHTITYDWTRCAVMDILQAKKDLRGVLDAEVVVLIIEEDVPYRGALVELGIALGAAIPVYVLGTALDDLCIFLKLGTPYLYRGIETLL